MKKNQPDAVSPRIFHESNFLGISAVVTNGVKVSLKQQASGLCFGMIIIVNKEDACQ